MEKIYSPSINGLQCKNKGHTAVVWSLLGCLSKLGSKNRDDPSRWHMKNYGIHPRGNVFTGRGCKWLFNKGIQKSAVNVGLQGVQNRREEEE